MANGETGLLPGRTYRVGLFEYTLEKAWFCQFCIGILICVNNGACFSFAILSPYLKGEGFRYSQFQIDAVSTVGVFLSYFSMPTGFLYDYKGPTAILLVGTLLNTTGWAGMYLIFTNVLTHSPVVMAIFFGLSQFSASFYETGSVLTNLKSFSCYKGRVILIQKTFMGLGSSLVAQLYVAFFEKASESLAPFFIFLLLYSTFTGLLGILYVHFPTPDTECVGINVEDADTIARGGGEPRMFAFPFNIGTGILCCSVTFVLLTSLVENYVNPLSTAVRVSIGVITICLTASFISMIFTTPNYEVNRRRGAGDEGMGDANDRLSAFGPSIGSSSKAADKMSIGASMDNEDGRRSGDRDDLSRCVVLPAEVELTVLRKDELTSPEMCYKDVPTLPQAELGVACGDTQEGYTVLNDKSLWENVKHIELWLLWFVCFGAWSAMTVVSTNSSHIYQAMSHGSFSLTINSVFVSIYGVASALGRILVGALYPQLARRQVSESLMLLVAPILNIIGLPLFLICPARFLFVPFFVVGLAVGFSWGCTVLIATSIFTSNSGKHYSFLYTAGMISPFIFNMALFGPIYDNYGAKQGHRNDGTCDGAICIAVPLIVCMVVNILGVPSAYVFYKLTKAPR
ncbi:membrane transporter, putative [Leishmania panamensis]|uniref:Membrane transporter, putative n=1 Tax=Leishmania panamensis TaxID=5679 RepID=A0A088RJZ0_LEIPA|nr:membrane transporter, putative [Leishmania panamensis]AIN96322.1 membrane transporter, putative [Leishmania panamensis]